MQIELKEIPKNPLETEFVRLGNGKRLVVFDPDVFIWNAYGKDSLDQEDDMTEEQWREMLSHEKYCYLELDDYHHDVVEKYKKDHKLGDYKE